MRGAGAVRSADVVLALLERQGMFAALWKRSGLPPYAATPLVIWSCWLADDIRSADADDRAPPPPPDRGGRPDHPPVAGTRRRSSSTSGSPRSGCSPSPTASATATTRRPSRRSSATSRSSPSARTAGATTRTLVEAVRGTDLVVDIVCKPDNVAGLDIPANVRVHAPVSLPEYRALLRRAQVVAVPTVRPGLPDRLERRARGRLDRLLRRRHAARRSMRDLVHRRATTAGWSRSATSRGGATSSRELRDDTEQRSRPGRGRAALRRAAVQRRPHVD